MRVLILEDDLWIADLLKQIVLSLRPGARVDCQVRVADAISAWQREPAQLVIADWNLPDGSGTLLLQAIFLNLSRTALVLSLLPVMLGAIRALTGFMPNTLVLGAAVRRTLRSHPDIADRIKYVGIGLADEAKLQELFDVPNVVCARSIYNSADEGATDAFQYIVNTRAMWLGYIEPNPGLDSPTAIANFSWQGLIPGQTNDFGGVITRGREPRAYSDWFHNRMAFDLKVVAADLGVFFSTTVSASA
jgi:hypothetical protein